MIACSMRKLLMQVCVSFQCEQTIVCIFYLQLLKSTYVYVQLVPLQRECSVLGGNVVASKKSALKPQKVNELIFLGNDF